MTPKEFASKSYSELERLTGVAKCRWSLYFNRKKGVSEATLQNIAIALDMRPEDVISGLRIRREKNN